MLDMTRGNKIEKLIYRLLSNSPENNEVSTKAPELNQRNKSRKAINFYVF